MQSSKAMFVGMLLLLIGLTLGIITYLDPSQLGFWLSAAWIACLISGLILVIRAGKLAEREKKLQEVIKKREAKKKAEKEAREKNEEKK